MRHLAISTLGVLHLEAGRAHVAFTIGLVEPFSRRSEGEPASTEVLVEDAFRAGANSAPAAVPRWQGTAITSARAAGALIRISGSASDPFISLP
jgi:hypothetical protein